MSFIHLDEMNGCMVQYMDEIHSLSMNPMGIGIEIFTLTSIRGFQWGAFIKRRQGVQHINTKNMPITH
jgi:hypothetical protein